MKTPIPFVGGAYKMPAVDLDAQTCINLYPTRDQTGKYESALLPVRPLAVWSAANENEKEVRVLYSLNGKLYAVIDDSFILLSGNGARLKTLGTLKTSKGQVRIIANDFQLFLTDGQTSYTYQVKSVGTLGTATYQAAGTFSENIASIATISTPVFSGSGNLNDMTAQGNYTGSSNKGYIVQIDSISTDDDHPDTFQWSDNGGATYTTFVPIVANYDFDLGNGISITFTNATGHKLNDKWTFSVTVDKDYPKTRVPAYQDTYGVLPEINSQTFTLTQLDDFTRLANSGSAPNVLKATAYAYPDNLVGAVSIREELWLIGEMSTEVWYNTGGSATNSFPFERRQSLLLYMGCLAPYSITNSDNNFLFWLGRSRDGDRVVIMIQGYEPKVISNEPLNAELRNYSKVDDAIGWSMQLDGHLFYTLTFPTADRTWVYDVTTNEWHERRSTLTNTDPSTSDTRQGRWRANCYAIYEGRHLVGDFESGNIYEMVDPYNRDNSYTENGNYILRERTTRHINPPSLNRMFMHSLQVDIDEGVGTDNGQGANALLMLQVSRDGGTHFGNERWRKGGKVGDRVSRVRWNRLGFSKGRDFTFRLRCTDPIPLTILGAVADMEEGNA